MLTMKIMARNAHHFTVFIQKHIRRNAHRGDSVHRMRPQFVSVVSAMASQANIAGFQTERGGDAGQGKAGVTFDASNRDRPVVGAALSTGRK